MKREYIYTQKHRDAISRGLKGRTVPEETKRKISETHAKRSIRLNVNCFICSKLRVIRPCEVRDDNKYCCSPKCRGIFVGKLLKGRKHRPPSHKGKTYKEIYGDKWQEQIEKRRISHIKTFDILGRKTHRSHHTQDTAYKNWRKSVFERDNYSCVICNIRGGELHADHIKDWANHKELRYETENGRTLCKPCHLKTPNYGGRNSWKKHTKVIRKK